MEKIIVIGPSGAGKSEFSRKLNKLLNIPVYHLDNLFWNKDKTHIERDELILKIKEIITKDSWIIDGDYAKTYELRMDACDTIIFLNYPLDVCLSGVESRISKVRLDIPWVEEEFDPEFKQWIKDWYINKLPILLRLLDKYKNNKEVIIFNSRIEAENFLNNLKK